MKMLTVFFFLCAMMALTPSAAHQEAKDEPVTEQMIVEHEAFPTDMLSPIPTTVPLPEGGFVFSCPDGWTMFSTRCLLYIPTNMTWAEAEENCRHHSEYHDGTLASVYDSEASHQIHDMLKGAGHEHGKVWVGGSNTAENPSWSWSDFLGITQFHDFCSKKHEHHCLQITFEENEAGCLDDMDCEAKLPSICAVILM